MNLKALFLMIVLIPVKSWAAPQGCNFSKPFVVESRRLSPETDEAITLAGTRWTSRSHNRVLWDFFEENRDNISLGDTILLQKAVKGRVRHPRFLLEFRAARRDRLSPDDTVRLEGLLRGHYQVVRGRVDDALRRSRETFYNEAHDKILLDFVQEEKKNISIDDAIRLVREATSEGGDHILLIFVKANRKDIPSNDIIRLSHETYSAETHDRILAGVEFRVEE